MADDPLVARLLQLAAEAPTKQGRLGFLMEAALRPGLTAFKREHVLVHGGPTVAELPDVYMTVFAALTAEMVDAGALNCNWSLAERRRCAKWCAERFAGHLMHMLSKARVEGFGELRRPDA